jgi:ElaB/YqjD/DUF883 family membrane-anchored ribosome-binding protein
MADMPKDFVSAAAAVAGIAVDRAGRSAHQLAGRTAEKAAPAIDRLRAGVEDLATVQERWIESSRTCVRDHPLVSLGLAVAAGMLLRRLMQR